MSSYGLKFKEKHSYKDFGLIMKSVDRSLLPAVKRQQIDIPFIDGKIDLQREPVYDNRIITVSFIYHFKDLYDMQAKKRQMAGWLSGSGNLVFDDEPDKFYEAKVFDAIAIEQSLKRMSVQVAFECKPFALRNTQLQVSVITVQDQRVLINIAGNVKTCGTIVLKNIGTTTITRLKLSRERSKD